MRKGGFDRVELGLSGIILSEIGWDFIFLVLGHH